MYIMGIDGGGTKTQCYVGNVSGEILGQGFGGEANYQVCGLDKAETSIKDAIKMALNQAGLTLSQIQYAVFGLSGADEPCDFDVLEPMCKSIVGDTPFVIYNDTWIGLRSGSPYGVVSICGTGGAHAGMNRAGERCQLRNVDYLTGNRGGGGEIVEEALHYGFRSNEGTYVKSTIEAALLSLFGVPTMDDVCEVLRTEGIPRKVAYELPIAVFKLAGEGDQVAREIIDQMARAEGQYAAAIIKSLGMTNDPVPLVLIGSIFATGNPLVIKPYLEEVQKVAPKSVVMLPKVPPVMGALWLAMDQMASNGI